MTPCLFVRYIPRLAAVSLVFLACWLGASAAQQVALDQDARVVELLREGGSDLSKPHPVDFFFVLPTLPAAEGLATKIQDLGYSMSGIKQLPDNGLWEVKAQRATGACVGVDAAGDSPAISFGTSIRWRV
jgi:hypothetical protein